MRLRAVVAAAAATGLLALARAAGGAPAGPAPLSAPQVTGIARAGSTLTGGTGSWSGSGTIRYAYRWSRCDALGARCTGVPGATGQAYRLAAADVGRTIGLVVTAADASGSAAGAASLVGPIAPAPAPLASSARPAVSGSAVAGSALTVSTGTWTVAPSAIAYSWLRCDAAGRACTPVAGATGATYTASTADVGHALVARLEASAGPAAQSVLSLASPPVATSPGAVGRPTIAGVAQVGRRLTGAPPPGEPAGATPAFQWYRCDAAGAHCSSVHGATAASYVTTARDAGQTLGLTVRDGTAAAYSSLIGPIAPAAAPADATAQPVVTGTAIEGGRLTASPGTWSASPSGVRYAWLRCNPNGRLCTAIAGASGAAYVPVDTDIGHALVAEVVASFGRGSQPAFSLATAPIRPAALADETPPTVAGTLRVGQRLTGSPGLWTGSPPIAYGYRWSRCDADGAHCSGIHGAAAGTYRLVAADAGRTISLAVTASGAAGTRTAYASLVGPVAPAAAALASTAQPRASGSPQVGGTVSVDAGVWTTTPATLDDTWLRCNANGRVCAPIPGASGAAYEPVAADVGHALVAVVTAHAGAGSASAWSTSTRPVQAGP